MQTTMRLEMLLSTCACPREITCDVAYLSAQMDNLGAQMDNLGAQMSTLTLADHTGNSKSPQSSKVCMLVHTALGKTPKWCWGTPALAG